VNFLSSISLKKAFIFGECNDTIVSHFSLLSVSLCKVYVKFLTETHSAIASNTRFGRRRIIGSTKTAGQA